MKYNTQTNRRADTESQQRGKGRYILRILASVAFGVVLLTGIYWQVFAATLPQPQVRTRNYYSDTNGVMATVNSQTCYGTGQADVGLNLPGISSQRLLDDDDSPKVPSISLFANVAVNDSTSLYLDIELAGILSDTLMKTFPVVINGSNIGVSPDTALVFGTFIFNGTLHQMVLTNGAGSLVITNVNSGGVTGILSLSSTLPSEKNILLLVQGNFVLNTTKGNGFATLKP